MTGGPWDAGLQAERTLLAWRRTCLAIGVAGLLLVRFLAPGVGAPAVALGCGGAILSVAAYLGAAMRYRRIHLRLVGGESLPAGSVPITLVAASVVALGIGCGCWLAVSVP